MNQDGLLVMLLAAGVVLAAGTPEAGQAAADAGAQATTEAARATTPEQERAAGAQAGTGEPQAPHDASGTRTDEARTAADAAQAEKQEDGTLTQVPGGKALGMSILGNQEAPTSLVIVPWKTSELGGSPAISPMLDDSRQPVDKDVFMRALRYHAISSGTARQDDSTAGGGEHEAGGSGAAQSTAARRR